MAWPGSSIGGGRAGGDGISACNALDLANTAPSQRGKPRVSRIPGPAQPRQSGLARNGGRCLSHELESAGASGHVAAVRAFGPALPLLFGLARSPDPEGTPTDTPAAEDPTTRIVRGRLTVVWTAPSECPDAESIVSQVERSLSTSLTDLDGGAVRLVGTVVGEDESWRIDLRLQTESGDETQQATAAACAPLAELAALRTASALDPSMFALLPEPPPGPTEDEVAADGAADTQLESPPDEHAVAPSDVEPASSSARRPLQAMLGVDAGMGLGLLPGVGVSVGAFVGLRWTFARLDLTAIYWTPRAVHLDQPSDVGGSFQVGAVGLRGCGVPQVRRVEFPLCAGLEFGAMRGVGLGLAQPTVVHRPWVVAVATPGIAVVLAAKVALYAQVGMAVPLVRARFAVVDVGDVFTLGSVGFRGAVGVALRLP